MMASSVRENERGERVAVATRGLAVVTLAFLGCASQGGEDGGGDHLPDRGITGWQRDAADPDTPFALGDLAGPALGGPSALVVQDRLFLYGHRALLTGDLELFCAEADGESFLDPVVLVSDGAPLKGRDPSVVFEDGTTWLAFVDSAGAVALAISTDGIAFRALAITGIALDRTAPSLVLDGPRVRLYLSTGTTLVHTEAPREALAFQAETVVLTPGLGCTDPRGDAKPCWDEKATVEAEVRRATSPTGVTVYRAFYAGRASGDSDLGFAASYDGLTFSRFAYNPVLTGSFDELSPTSVIAGGRYLLFWQEARSATASGIMRATHVPSAPADRW